MDLLQLKTKLKSEHGVLVLDDMGGPVDMNGGRAIAAYTRKFPEQIDNADLVAEIAAQTKNKAIAFYQFYSDEFGHTFARYGLYDLN